METGGVEHENNAALKPGMGVGKALDRIISAKNAMEGIVAKEMYIRGFLDYERLVCEKDSKI